ncbi:hypothetical protein BDC45DRAFT_598268 [Circinella umbellata]|nr:hypothetical protein BDC45DRAFT_598268 [Circinella umbellata]
MNRFINNNSTTGKIGYWCKRLKRTSNLGPVDLVEEEEEEVVEEKEEGQNLMEKGTTSTNIIPSAGQGSRSKGKSVASTPEEKVKEASATHIRKLEGLIKALLCNPKIERTENVSDNEILKAFHDKSFKSDEIAVIKLITNQLLPYSPHSDSMCLLTPIAIRPSRQLNPDCCRLS